MWCFKLEIASNLKTKRFWLIFILLGIMYTHVFLGIKDTMQGSANPKILIGHITTSTYIPAGILTLLLGATSINDDISKGTAEIIISKPINRVVGYFVHKFLGQSIVITGALITSTLFSISIAKCYGLHMSERMIENVFLITLLTLLAMIQLLALGYLISLIIRSPNIALGASLVLFLIISFILPQIVENMAENKAKDEFGISGWKDYSSMSYEEIERYKERIDELQREYDLRFLFYAPNIQLLDIAGDLEGTAVNNIITHNLSRIGIMIGLTLIYLILGLAYFKRMDLR
ncbi:MAG: ABC transporter permease subunit [Thermococcus sp.]|nr:ABC transporter permease subunit [Thermococcus sp.]